MSQKINAGLVIAVLLLSYSSSTYAQSIGEQSVFQIAQIQFELSNGEFISAEKGSLLVPENRTVSDSRLIPINFVRFPSVSSTPSAPVFYLAAGPGSSGIQVAARRFSFFSKLQEVADVIVIEQRGTGSDDMTCPERVYLSTNVALLYREVVSLFIDKTLPCKAHFEGLGYDLRGYTTVESAHDINAIREVLELDKISLIGSSYGSHYALAILKLYDEIVDRVVIAGVEGPNHSYSLPSVFDKHLDDIDSLFREQYSSYNENQTLRQMLDRAIERLSVNPAAATVTIENRSVEVQIGKFELQLLIYSLLSRERTIPQVPRLIIQLNNEVYEQAAQSIYQLKSQGQSISAMLIMMDGASGATEDRLNQLSAERDTTTLGPVTHFLFPDIATAWQTPDLGSEYRSLPESSRPTLMISGSLDARTPISNAEEIAKGLPNSQQLIVKNTGHPPSLSELGDLINDFLQGKSISSINAPQLELNFPPL